MEEKDNTWMSFEEAQRWDKIKLDGMKMTNYSQVVPNSHRWTLYGLQNVLKSLRNQLIPDNPTQTELLDYIIKGLQNSIDSGEDITKII